MRVTVVVDNFVQIISHKPYIGEHGLSLLLETGDAKILLDTGQSSAVVHNLSLLGVHPDELDAIVLSHGHYDHTGGLAAVLQQRSKPVAIYAHTGIFQPRYSASGGTRRFIGIPQVKERLTALGAEWHLGDNFREIVPDLLFSGQILRQTDYEIGDANLVVGDNQGCDCQDAILDDTSLFYSAAAGLVVIGGCTHAGLVNTVEQGLKLTGRTRLAGWIGGTHLGPASEQQQEKTLAKLEQYAPDFVLANHCTGFSMMAELSRRFGSRFIPGFVGQAVSAD